MATGNPYQSPKPPDGVEIPTTRHRVWRERAAVAIAWGVAYAAATGAACGILMYVIGWLAIDETGILKRQIGLELLTLSFVVTALYGGLSGSLMGLICGLTLSAWSAIQPSRSPRGLQITCVVFSTLSLLATIVISWIAGFQTLITQDSLAWILPLPAAGAIVSGFLLSRRLIQLGWMASNRQPR